MVLRGQLSRGQLSYGGNCPGGSCPGGSCPGGSCPDTVSDIYPYWLFIHQFLPVLLLETIFVSLM